MNIHHKKNRVGRIKRPDNKIGVLRGFRARFGSGEEPMPQPSDRRLFLVAPGKVAVLAVKLLGNNFHRTKHAHERGRHEFSGHLWIFNIGRAALRTTNQSGGDVGVGGLPLDHLLLGLFELGVFYHHLCIRLRARHEADLLERRLIVNIGLYARVLKTSFQLPRFNRLVERRNSHHKFSGAPTRIV